MLKKASQSFCPQAKTVLIIFSGGMYVGENSSHGASVELFACGEQPRHRAQCSPFCQRTSMRFFDNLKPLQKKQGFLGFFAAFYYLLSTLMPSIMA